MTVPGHGRRRRATALLVGAAVAGALAGCTGAGGVDDRTAMQSIEAAPAASSAPADASPAPSERMTPTRGVACDVETCTLTLRTTEPREVRAFGATLSLDGIANGVASMTIGDGRVECRADESVEAGPLVLFCDDVTADSVRLTAEVG
jgi:hypothetical protein